MYDTSFGDLVQSGGLTSPFQIGGGGRRGGTEDEHILVEWETDQAQHASSVQPLKGRGLD